MTIAKAYIRPSRIIFLIYDVTNAYSCERMDYWNNFVKEQKVESEEFFVFLLANKSKDYLSIFDMTGNLNMFSFFFFFFFPFLEFNS